MQIHSIAVLAFPGIAVATVAVRIYATRAAHTTPGTHIASRAVGPVLNAPAVSGSLTGRHTAPESAKGRLRGPTAPFYDARIQPGGSRCPAGTG